MGQTSGDHFLRPLFIDSEWRAYEGLVLWVDPAGRGKDEMAWCVMGHLGGTLFVLKAGHHSGDPALGITKLCIDAKAYNVNVIEIEPNYGQGVFTYAVQQALTQVWTGRHEMVDPQARQSAIKRAADGNAMGGCTIQESEWASGQKELRIIDTLETLMTHHRIVIDEKVVRENVGMDDPRYSLMYQLTHVSRSRGSLRHDDRLESLAGAANHFLRAMEIDVDAAREGTIQAERDEMFEDFVEQAQSNFPFGQSRGRMRSKMQEGGGYNEVWQFSG